ncbi:MAG: putative porin [Methylophilaceae bacterium]|nr:putative porin [Methylophilaceae bacterium]
MTFKLRSIAAATTAALIMGFGANAMADSTTDIVNALVTKGVLTEEEGNLLLKGREGEQLGQEKAMKKATKLKVSDAIDNATVYGDIRIRYENRQGSGVPAATIPATPLNVNTDATRERARYKLTLGVKTESGPWYTDLALAMGANGRSDNATFGSSASTNLDDKQQVFIKRAMIGWKATDWFTLEAGRTNNPLYTTPMVWDADLNFEGINEQAKFKLGDADVFLTAAQGIYQGDRRTFNITNTAVTDTVNTELFAFQGGARYGINDTTSAKAAITFTTINNSGVGANSAAGSKFLPTLRNAANTATNAQARTNDLNTIEIPGEINFMTSSNVGIRLFGDYVYNTTGDDRFKSAQSAATAGTQRDAIKAAGNDDTAWMLGVAIGSAKDLKAFEANKMAKGDWSARVWYQDVGVYSVDPNAVDSDFMDSRVNMKGTTFKAQYNIEDNVYVNLAYGHAKRKNGDLGAVGAAQDLALNLKDFDLLQLDLTYKF